MNRLHRRLGLGLLLAAAPGFAQTTTTGSVSGVVTDPGGAAVAGATVSLSSAQVTRSVITGSDGSFRIGLLNPGSWQMRITKEGLQPAARSITVNTNENQTLNFKMAMEATKTVEITASNVDVTTTQTGLALSSEKVASLPLASRDFNSLAFFAPGVVDSGFGDPSISGASGAENAYYVDGLQSKDFRFGFQGQTLKTDFVDQIEVQTGGFKPEYSALGGVFSAILKSGTNDFKGTAWVTWDPIGIHARTKSNQFFTSSQPNTRYDVGFEVGGPIVKDKLFYWVGLDADLAESPGSEPNKDPGLVSSKAKTNSINALAKLNWFINQDQQLSASVNYSPTTVKQNTAYPNTGTANLGSDSKTTTTSVNLNYDWQITSSLALSLKAGYSKLKFTVDPKDTTDNVTDYLWYDVGPGSAGPLAGSGLAYTTGGIGQATQSLSEGTSKQFRADLNWFVGSHNLKFGVSYLESDYLRRFDSGPNGFFTIYYNPYEYNIPNTNNYVGGNDLNQVIQTSNSTVKADFTAYYAQDTWEIASGFRVFYGARFETQEQKDAHGHTFMKFNNFKDYAQPRLGFTWDLNNDGKAKLSGSYGVYFETIPQRLATRVFGNEVLVSYDYYAVDPTTGGAGKYNYDPSNPNHYGTVAGGLGLGNADLVNDYGTPFSYDPIADGTKLPQRQEYTFGFDYTLPNGMVAGIHGKHRKLKNVIEDSVITQADGTPYDYGAPYTPGDPSTAYGQAILWNPGPNVSWTANQFSSTPGHYTVNGTFYGPAGNTYDSFDFTLEKKTDHASWNFNYTWSRLFGNYEGLVSSSNGQADGNITASFDYYPYVGDGLLPLDRTHVVKFFGSYRWDFGKNALTLGYNWTYQSGTPVSLFDDGSSSVNQAPGSLGRGNVPYDIGYYGNATPDHGLLGNHGRTPATNNVDLHLDYNWMLGRKMHLIPSIDMFNLFNTRYATGVYQLATDGNAIAQPNYGQPNGYQDGRRYRFGIKLQF